MKNFFGFLKGILDVLTTNVDSKASDLLTAVQALGGEEFDALVNDALLAPAATHSYTVAASKKFKLSGIELKNFGGTITTLTLKRGDGTTLLTLDERDISSYTDSVVLSTSIVSDSTNVAEDALKIALQKIELAAGEIISVTVGGTLPVADIRIMGALYTVA